MTAIEDVLGADQGAEDPFGSGSLEVAQYEPFSFTVKRLVLAALVAKAVSVVPTGNAQPMLSNFQVHVAPGLLRLAATDLELSVLASTPAVTVADGVDQVLCLPARKLLSILREAPDGDVSVDVSGEHATVRAGTASWVLQLVDCSEYPPLPDPAEVEMSPVGRAAFLDALKVVRHAVGRDTGRPPLMQVDISAAGEDGKAKVTASDGVRFARTVLAGSLPMAMQIPEGALDSLVKTLESSDLEDIHVGQTSPERGQGHLVFRISGTAFLASKMAAKFPDVEKLLLRPALENKLALAVDKTELAGAIRRVRINADPETSAIGLHLASGRLTALARDKYGNRAEETVSASWDGPERLVVVNHQFMSDLLAVFPSPVCRFWLGPDAGKKRTVLMLKDEETGTIGIIYQMLAALVGYGD